MPEAPITRLLEQLAQGHTQAEAELLPLVYERLRALAARIFADERQDHTLEPTALVHDAWMKLAGEEGAGWRSRAQFFAVSAKVMRRLLVDHARARNAEKRGGQHQRVELASQIASDEGMPGSDLLEFDEVLDKLTRLDPRQARIVELRFFSGLTVPEVADCLDVSVRTVEAEWTLAKAWLRRALEAR